MFDQRMTREEVAELFGVAAVTVDAWAAQGILMELTRFGGR